MSEKKPFKILVADDEESIRSIVAEVLSDEGYPVEIAANGAEALEKVEKGDIHVVITDIRMPEMTGIELLEKVKAYNASIEVVIMTSHASMETAIQAIRLGAYDYLTKPFDDLDIIPTVIDRTVEKLRLELEVQNLLSALKKKNDEIQHLYEKTTELFSNLDIDDILNKSVEALTELGQNQFKAAYFQYQEDKKILTPVAASPKEAMDLVDKEIAITETPLTNEVFQKIENHQKLQKQLCGNSDVTETKIYPIFSGEKFAGAFVLCCAKSLSEDVTKVVQQYMGNVAVQIEKARLHKTIKIMATRDGLTNLFNRRYFQNRLEHEIKRAHRFDEELSFILFDIDHFKNYNDTNGHLQGDALLKEISKLISETSRSIDVVARYGGEEFAIILLETSKSGAAVRAETLRKDVEGHTFAHQEKQPLGNLTVSGGFSTYPADGDTADKLIEAADKALYAAKESGRNKLLPAK